MSNKGDKGIKRTILKITMLGDSAVGKTSITNTFLGQKFSDDKLSTLGNNKMETTMEMKDGKKMKIIILDTAGQERFHSISTSTIKSANGVVVTFDLTMPKTFESVVRWLDEINNNNNNIPIVLFGNKCDLERQVSKEEIDKFLEDHKQLTYFETSAKLNINIKEGYKKVIDEAYDVIKKSGSGEGLELKKNDKNEKPKKKCC